jgi:hypothetical protein
VDVFTVPPHAPQPHGLYVSFFLFLYCYSFFFKSSKK